MLYYRCAKAYRSCEFGSLMHALTLVEPRLGPYLQEVEGRQYNIMTTNISECINAILVKERELPVTALAEETRCLVQRWHYKRQTKAEKCKTKLTPSAEGWLSEQYQQSFQIRLDPASNTVYTVFDRDKNGLVDLDRQMCSYRHFQLEQLTYAHAMIVIRHRKQDVYEFCSDYYSFTCWKATYTAVVYPLPHQGDWVIPNKVLEKKVFPLVFRSIAGRRRKSQIPFVGEMVQRHKCNWCRQSGHHRKTCKNLIPLHLNEVPSSDTLPCSGPT
ncbi:hypothetical protein UlMin_021127 [Ulmus minor]